MAGATRRSSRGRQARVSALLEAGRDLGASTVLFHGAIADRLGLHPTEHKCVDLLVRHGPMTAGELAKVAGLTTGATTGLIDRLEAGGFVRRERDTTDRRRVMVEPCGERYSEVGPCFMDLGRAMSELAADYDDDQLQVVTEYITRASQVLRRHAARIRGAAHD
jgi:DNA-binding transcriptional ArsR family regulator